MKTDFQKIFKYQEKAGWCGPAVIQMVLLAAGIKKTQKAIAKDVYKSWWGTNQAIMYSYLSRYFKKLDFKEGAKISDLKHHLDRKHLVIVNWWDDYDFLLSKPRNLDLEGYLFPDTYRIFRDASIKDVVQRTLNNFDQKLTPELRNEIERQGKTIHDIITLASILEKEVSTDYDRAMVADIFYKRIKIGMPLQADSTVNYVTGKSESRSTIIDTKTDDPYNTYKYKGLPPGPICNPSLSAIKAAIYPKANNYYYFLTTPDGQVIYSQTHDQHVAAKAKYYPLCDFATMAEIKKTVIKNIINPKYK